MELSSSEEQPSQGGEDWTQVKEVEHQEGQASASRARFPAPLTILAIYLHVFQISTYIERRQGDVTQEWQGPWSSCVNQTTTVMNSHEGYWFMNK